MAETLSDEKLLEMFAQMQTRETAFRLIVKKYSPAMYNQIRRIVHTHEETDDILQNALVKVWRALSNFRAEAKLFTWLYRIVTNETLSYLSEKKRKLTVSIDDENSPATNIIAHETIGPEGDKIYNKLIKAVDSLPEKQRLVFNMKYFDEMKYEDMSEILQTSVGALKASYHFAVKKIEEKLNSD